MARRSKFRLEGPVRTSYLELVEGFPLTSIESEEHLAEAQQVMDRLLAKGRHSEAEAIYLDALSDLVALYEEAHHAIEAASDADILRHLLILHLRGSGGKEAVQPRDDPDACGVLSSGCGDSGGESMTGHRARHGGYGWLIPVSCITLFSFFVLLELAPNVKFGRQESRTLLTYADVRRLQQELRSLPTSEIPAELPDADIWGQPYRVVTDNDDEITVLSAGPNGTVGDEDDIYSGMPVSPPRTVPCPAKTGVDRGIGCDGGGLGGTAVRLLALSPVWII